jgi:uncharacterized protein (DUF2062 family)
VNRLKDALRRALTESLDSPARAASAVGLGAFVGFSPAWGFHATLALLLAHLFRLNKPLAVAASMISVPPLIPFIVFASLAAGRFLLGEGNAFPAFSASGMTPPLEAGRENMAAWIVGSFALAFLAGAAAWLAAFAGLLARERFKATRRKNPASVDPR